MSNQCLCDECRRDQCPKTAEIVQLTGENMTLRSEAKAQAKNYAELGRHYKALESQNVQYRAEIKRLSTLLHVQHGIFDVCEFPGVDPEKAAQIAQENVELKEEVNRLTDGIRDIGQDLMGCMQERAYELIGINDRN